MSTTPDTDDNPRNAYELSCPAPGCDYRHESPQGISGHVGAVHGGWDDLPATPADVHLEATANDPDASRRAAKVRAWLARNGVTSDAVLVYEHQGFGNIQITLDGYVEDFSTFRDAVRDTDGIHYAGNDVNWCTDEFVRQLSTPATAGACEVDECDSGRGLAPVIHETEAVTLCRYHRKHFWGVSS